MGGARQEREPLPPRPSRQGEAERWLTSEPPQLRSWPAEAFIGSLWTQPGGEWVWGPGGQCPAQGRALLIVCHTDQGLSPPWDLKPFGLRAEVREGVMESGGAWRWGPGPHPGPAETWPRLGSVAPAHGQALSSRSRKRTKGEEGVAWRLLDIWNLPHPGPCRLVSTVGSHLPRPSRAV